MTSPTPSPLPEKLERCKHANTAAASAIKYASVWCPDCKQWVEHDVR